MDHLLVNISGPYVSKYGPLVNKRDHFVNICGLHFENYGLHLGSNGFCGVQVVGQQCNYRQNYVALYL